ncbi:hypothetical protein LSTR_LSTR010945 [Laodelphax striatellus]|uniref:Uncharacterized protein n=1 Tax=Laodelphax striatellus TaxID=195883 RepID=A0A482XSW0_LAOST|nr:hypothetical protein LSTR_LSTR010945 [Laodelphax striatellus]
MDMCYRRHVGVLQPFKKLAEEKGPCLDAKEIDLMERFTHNLAIAPTASISIIAGNTSSRWKILKNLVILLEKTPPDYRFKEASQHFEPSHWWAESKHHLGGSTAFRRSTVIWE